MVRRRLRRVYPLHIAVVLLWIAIFYGKQLVNIVLLGFGIDLGMTPPTQQLSFDWVYLVLNALLPVILAFRP